MFDSNGFARMAQQLAGIEGRFLLSFNDVPEIRTVFAAFHIAAVTTTYSITARTGDSKDRAELLISNWPLGVRNEA